MKTPTQRAEDKTLAAVVARSLARHKAALETADMSDEAREETMIAVREREEMLTKLTAE